MTEVGLFIAVKIWTVQEVQRYTASFEFFLDAFKSGPRFNDKVFQGMSLFADVGVITQI